MLDAALALPAQAFTYHPVTRETILVTEGQRGYRAFNVHLSPFELNFTFRHDLLPSRVAAMLDYALDHPALTDIDVSGGWPS